MKRERGNMYTTLYYISIFLGMFFFGVGTIGIIRMPDAFSRAHSAAKCDTLGAAFSILALIFIDGFQANDIKLLLVIVLIWFTNPTATHLIGRAIYRNSDKGVK